MSSRPIVYYKAACPPARAVLLVVKALGADVELRAVDFAKGENKTPEFLKMNPQHTVPTLEDNGKYLNDSHAIATYLIEKFGNSDDHPLYPKDLYTRARIDQRLHFESGVLFQSLITVVRCILYEGAVEITDVQSKNIFAAFDTLETFLAVDTYMVGDELTVADLSMVATLTQLVRQVGLDSNRYPKIGAWIKRIEALPYYDEVITANSGDLFKTCIANAAAEKAKRQI